MKYSVNGDVEWTRQWAGPFGTNDGATDIAVAESGDVFLVGHSYSPTQQENAVVIRYRQMDPAAAPALAPLDGAPRLWVVGSPCSEGSGIRYDLPRGTTTRLSVHDALGRKIRVLRSGFETAGSHEARWDTNDDPARPVPNGTYFVTIEPEGQQRVSARVIVIR